MSDDSFASILDQPASEIERPKQLPPGTYHCVVDGQYREGESSQKGTKYIEFSLKPMQALDDVNEDDLNAALMSSNGSVKPLSDKRIRATFYLTEDAKYRLKDFLANDLGIDTNKGKKKLIQMVGEAQNRQVLAKIRNVPTQDGTGVYPRLEKTAPVTEE